MIRANGYCGRFLYARWVHAYCVSSKEVDGDVQDPDLLTRDAPAAEGPDVLLLELLAAPNITVTIYLGNRKTQEPKK